MSFCRRVLRIEKWCSLILLVKIAVSYFAGFSRLSPDQLICAGLSSCKSRIFCGEFVKANARSNPTASVNRLIVQVKRTLFKNKLLGPKIFFSKDWQGSTHDRI